jgi:hypothetical protein
VFDAVNGTIAAGGAGRASRDPVSAMACPLAFTLFGSTKMATSERQRVGFAEGEDGRRKI